MKSRRNFIKNLFKITAVAVLATAPLMVMPSIKKDFVNINFGEVKWTDWNEQGWKVGSFNISITGEGEKFEAMVEILK